MKNKKISVCVFPETVPGDALLFPLVQVFTPIVYCQVVEEDEVPEILSSPLSDELMAEGIVHVHIPSPLGEDRNRFLSLIHDLMNHRDDYTAQLKNLALAGIGQGGQRKTESKNSIIESLLKNKGVTEELQEARNLLLWQARLLLKLGEIFDAEQKSLQAGMEKIRQRESSLFDEMREEKGTLFSLTKALSLPNGQPDGLQKLRLKAWVQLYCLGAKMMEQRIFISTNRDAVDHLVEEFEHLRDEQAHCFLKVLLPAQSGGDFQLQSVRELQQNEQIFLRLNQILSDPAGVTEDDKNAVADFASILGEWGQLLDAVYPEERHGRCLLHLHLLQNIEPCELFTETFARAVEQPKGFLLEQENMFTVIGWLEECPC